LSSRKAAEGRIVSHFLPQLDITSFLWVERTSLFGLAFIPGGSLLNGAFRIAPEPHCCISGFYAPCVVGIFVAFVERAEHDYDVGM